MTWSRFDDGYDEHEKIEDAWFDGPPNPVGLHVMATTACNRWATDGVIRPRWLEHKLPKPRERARILDSCVRHGLFDRLPAGRIAELTDDDGHQIAVGPFAEERFLVHDFLDRHESSLQRDKRRAADAERKRKGKASGTQTESSRNPDGDRAESGASRTDARVGAHTLPDPTHTKKDPPAPPKGGRQRDRHAFEEECSVYGREHFPDVNDSAAAVRQAVTFRKATTLQDVQAFVDEHFRSVSA